MLQMQHSIISKRDGWYNRLSPALPTFPTAASQSAFRPRHSRITSQLIAAWSSSCSNPGTGARPGPRPTTRLFPTAGPERTPASAMIALPTSCPTARFSAPGRWAGRFGRLSAAPQPRRKGCWSGPIS